MRYIKYSIIVFTILILGGCANTECKPKDGAILKGTGTAVVGLYIDKNGYPQANVEKVTVAPGQRIIFVGPNQFEIIFKDQKSPIEKSEVRTSNGVLIIDIPKDAFEQEDRRNPENKSKNEMVYRYGIRANGKTTDPYIVISPR